METSKKPTWRSPKMQSPTTSVLLPRGCIHHLRCLWFCIWETRYRVVFLCGIIDTDPKTAWTTKQMGWLSPASLSDGVPLWEDELFWSRFILKYSVEPTLEQLRDPSTNRIQKISTFLKSNQQFCLSLNVCWHSSLFFILFSCVTY